MPTDYAIKDGRTVFDATTYTGTNGSQSVTNTAGFKPDLVWVKDRSNANNHIIVDSVRGATSGVYGTLFSNATLAEQTTNSGSETAYGIISAINSNGFTAASGSVNAGTTNFSGHAYVGWQWQAGQGTTSSNTSGSITSTVSVNQAAGFSIVTYTGTTSAATVGHGLGVAPKMIIVKKRSGTGDWPVYHASLGNTSLVWLNLTNSSTSTANAWNNTSPTSSVFTVGVGGDLNTSGGTHVAYCWAEVAGFSKFGSYTPNNSNDGPFIYTGFRPKFILLKSTTNTWNWAIWDSSRNLYNTTNSALAPNISNAEWNGDTYYAIDFLSNGFKIRNTGQESNQGTNTIYAAFAENPFKYSNAR